MILMSEDPAAGGLDQPNAMDNALPLQSLLRMENDFSGSMPKGMPLPGPIKIGLHE